MRLETPGDSGFHPLAGRGNNTLAGRGAEIRSCCRLAALLDTDLATASRHVVPVAVTAAESVGNLRSWASGRCLDAGQPGIYAHHGQASGERKRSIPRDASMN